MSEIKEKDNPGDMVKDLYKLVGNYEATTQRIFSELTEIKSKITIVCDENNKDHADIKRKLDEIESGVDENKSRSEDNVKRLDKFERTGVPSNTSKKIDSALILSVVNTIAQIVKTLLGIP